jgi:hypothetical protein
VEIKLEFWKYTEELLGLYDATGKGKLLRR